MTESKHDGTIITTMSDKLVLEKVDDNNTGIELHNIKFLKPEYDIYKATRNNNTHLPPYIYSMDGSAPISVGSSIHKRVVVQGSEDILKIKSINGVHTEFAYHDYYYHAMLTDAEIRAMVGDDVYDT